MKKPKLIADSENNKIQVNRTRSSGKKKVDLFARLRNEEHPLDGMFPEVSKAEKTMPVFEPVDRPKIESSENASRVLAAPDKSASKKAKGASKKAILDVKGASLLAPLKQRTESQLLADLRQSKGNRVQIAIRIRPELKQAIVEFMAREKMSQQDFFEIAASQFIENFEQFLAKNSIKNSSVLALDDRRLLISRTSVLIINLYRAYNAGNKWTPKDDEVGVKYNDVDIRIIECGIIYTQQNAGYKKIRSFGYYQNEIDDYINQNLSEQALQYALESSRKFWQSATKKQIDLTFLNAEERGQE